MLTEAERELLALVIGHQVRDSRKQQGLSQLELAQGIGSQSMLSLIEGGHQLPLPDVLHLLAERLGDAALRQYAEMLDEGRFSFDDIAATNQEVLLDALRTQRGHWQDVYGKVAVQLCEHHYNSRVFGTVREICQLVDRHSESPPYRAQAYFYMGSAYLFESDYEKAESWLRKSAVLDLHLQGHMQGRLLYNLSYLYTALDTPGMAMWYAKCAAEIFAKIHDFPRHAKSLGMLGTIQHRIGLFDDAREMLELSQEISAKWQLDPVDTARIASTLAATYMELKEFHLAEKWSSYAIDVATPCNDTPTLCAAYRTLFFFYEATGELDNAKAALDQAIQFANSTDTLMMNLAHTYLLTIDYTPNMGDKVKAAEKAYEVASNAESLMEQAFAAECLVMLHEQQGRSETAHHYRRVALKAYRNHAQKNSMFKSVIGFFPHESDNES